MATGEPGFSLTEQQEGYADAQPDGSCIAYWDSIGCVWTIGYGTTGPDVLQGVRWTEAQAAARMEVDWDKFRAGVLRACPVLVNYPNRLGACTDFAYNEGIGAFASSTLHSLINRQDWSGATAQFAKWNIAGGRVIPDLVRRRASEVVLFQTPEQSSQIGMPLVALHPLQSIPIAVETIPPLDPNSKIAPHSANSDVEGLDTSSIPALIASFAKLLVASIQQSQ